MRLYHLIIKIKILKHKKEKDENIVQLTDNKTNKKTFSYFLFILVGLITLTNNIFAKLPEPEEFAKNTIIAKIIISQNENYFYNEIITEEGPAVIAKNNVEYEGSAMEAPLPTLQTTTDNPIFTNIISTEENSALVASHLSDESLKEQPRDKVISYVVETGDTVSGIAQKFGISVATILWSNDLTYYSMIKPGNILKIPPTTGLIYTVSKGDTLSSIAKKYSADADKILATNKLSTADQISIGLELIIPDGIRPADKIVATKITNTKNIIIPSKAEITNTGTKLLWPATGRITQYYSWRHTGLDIAAKSGTAVYAAESGTVETSGWNAGGYGYYIIINHGNGIQTLYAHSSKLLVSKGEKVSRGQTIMLMGSTGRSTGSHLHFEVRVGGYKKNPLSYIR